MSEDLNLSKDLIQLAWAEKCLVTRVLLKGPKMADNRRGPCDVTSKVRNKYRRSQG